MAGLRHDKVLAILQRVERVLSRREAQSYGAGGEVNVTIMARDAESFRQSRTQVSPFEQMKLLQDETLRRGLEQPPRPVSRPLEIADIFRAYGPAWRQANAGHVSLTQLKVMSAIVACRSRLAQRDDRQLDQDRPLG